MTRARKILTGARTMASRNLVLLILLVVACCFGLANAQSAPTQKDVANADAQNPSQMLHAVDQLVEQNRQLEKQNHELMDQIDSLRQVLAKQARATDATQKAAVATTGSTTASDSQQSQGSRTASQTFSSEEEPYKWGGYTPNLGYKVANTDRGDISISIYSYARYLNQLGLDPHYTDAFGNVKNVQQRQDFQLQKVQIKFLGWVMDPRFRYFLYAWTSNASQGLAAQVVLAGNLNYSFNKHISIGAGIRSLPGTRSVEGNFPFWLGVDTRLIADEFFRPSYTSGVWGWGQITDKLDYIVMLGNNLSTLGVSAAQLNNGFDTLSTSLVWTPTTGEFGPGFGDFEHHQILATRLAAHFTRSDEDKQSQPNSDGFENTQIRLEDGSVIFTPNLLGQGISITDVRYQMTSFDGGLKYHGYSLEGEYFLRWLDHFKGTGTTGLPTIFSHGFQLQAATMVLPKTLQIYLGGSTIYGKYGNPYDFRAGVNFFPFHNKVVRWNNEFLYLRRSAVGYPSVPFALGGNGPVFHSNLELAF
jgi:cell division protein FtsB